MTSRTEWFMLTLAHKVRWLRLDQVARLLEIESPVAVRRLVAALEAARLVRRVDVFLPPAEAVRAPIACWEPGGPMPMFGPLAHRMARRWAGPLEAHTIVMATLRAARLFGGHEGRLQHAARAHDAHVAAVYLHFCRTRPLEAMDWVTEAALAAERDGQVLPDAAVVNGDGRPRLIVEVVGHYPAERLARFHADCAARRLPYELW